MRTRQPIHQKSLAQEQLWQAIREMGAFTRESLLCHLLGNDISIKDATAKDYLARLTAGGYLDAHELSRHRTAIKYQYTLVKNTGHETPRLTREGRPVTQGRSREHLWRTIRVLGEFNYRELAAAASTEAVQVKETEAKDYVLHLKKAGYLKQIHAASNGGRLARYRLSPSRYTGPRPPQIQRTKQIYDPNLGEVVWTSQSTEQEAN